jgi:hypothetical protein
MTVQTAGEIRTDITACQLMRSVGNLRIGAETDSEYDPRRSVALLLDGLRVS